MSRSKQKYRAVLVGTGGIAEAHVAAAEAARGQVVLAAGVDVDEPRARAFCAKHRIPKCYPDFRVAIEKEEPDIVMIAAPPSLHAEMAIAAMRAGAWVFCEKPLCASLEECDRISRAEEETDCFTACIFQMRFASSTDHVKALAATGKWGPPLVAVCNTLWHRDEDYYSVPWKRMWDHALGGATLCQGIHAMDHLLYLWGPWTEVSSQMRRLARNVEVEDLSLAHITFANGAAASVVNSVLSPRQETYLRLDYGLATLELTHLYRYDRTNWAFTPLVGHESLRAEWEAAPPDFGSSHAAHLKAFLAAMDAGTRPAPSSAESRETMELATAIYKSAYLRRPVAQGTIGLEDPFYRSLHGGHKEGVMSSFVGAADHGR